MIWRCGERSRLSNAPLCVTTPLNITHFPELGYPYCSPPAPSLADCIPFNTHYCTTGPLDLVINTMFSFDVEITSCTCQSCPGITAVLDISMTGIELVGVDCASNGAFTLHAYARTTGSFQLAVTFDSEPIGSSTLTVTVSCLYDACQCFLFQTRALSESRKA